jgi:hypothetical protein
VIKKKKISFEATNYFYLSNAINYILFLSHNTDLTIRSLIIFLIGIHDQDYHINNIKYKCKF